jgi:hypothetical protein
MLMKMDGRTFVKLIENPQGIDDKALNQLIKVIEKYPYFSLAKLVYLKGLKVNGDARFSTLLSHVSTYAPSGEWLYLYLNDYEFGIQEAYDNQDDLQEEVNSAVETTLPQQPVASESNTATAPQIEEFPINDIGVIVEEVGHEHLASAALVEDGIVAEDVEEQQEEFLAATNKAEEEEAPEVSMVEEPIVEEHPSLVLDSEEPFEFIDDALESDKEDPIFEVLDQKLYTLDDNEKTLEIQNSLIDQFLSENPRIVPKPDLPPVNEDISVKSLKDEGDLVTESLAKVYAAQGLTDKAADIYRKLCLKFPEKKAYFVAQLEKLNESK